MTEWHEVKDSRPERPDVLDKTSSQATVYERRNIRQETTTFEMGGASSTVTEWAYEQREYTAEEYQMMISPAIRGVQQTLSEIQLSIDSL